LEIVKYKGLKEDIHMILCKACGTKRKNSEFNKDFYGEYLDICKECESERELDGDERAGLEEMSEYYEDK
jgi:transcription elongation factor Elf1